MAPSIITVKYSEYRPCLVNGKKALFHRFVEEDQVLLQFDGYLPTKGNYIQRIIEQYETDHILPIDVKTKTVKGTFALVEFEDGTVEKVDLKSIRFLDRKNLFLDALNKYLERRSIK